MHPRLLDLQIRRRYVVPNQLRAILSFAIQIGPAANSDFAAAADQTRTLVSTVVTFASYLAFDGGAYLASVFGFPLDPRQPATCSKLVAECPWVE
jgi:hypothetical protein